MENEACKSSSSMNHEKLINESIDNKGLDLLNVSAGSSELPQVFKSAPAW